MNEKRYVIDLIEYGIMIVLEVLLTKLIVQFIYVPSLLCFVFCAGICVAVPMGMNLVVFGKTNRVKSVKQILEATRKKA